jgi:transposase
LYENGDTKKQLLARGRYILFKPSSKWHDQQKARATILFREFPELKEAYDLSMMFRSIYEHSSSKEEAGSKLKLWYKKVREKNIDAFLTPSESVLLHEETILNYFKNRSTNASAESFNAKLKNFRAVVRGVRDKKFFLFRISMLYG